MSSPSRSGNLTSSAAVAADSANSRAGDKGVGLLDEPADDGLCGSDDDVCAAPTVGHWLPAVVIIRWDSALWMDDW